MKDTIEQLPEENKWTWFHTIGLILILAVFAVIMLLMLVIK